MGAFRISISCQPGWALIDDVITAWKACGAAVAMRVMTCNAHSRGYCTSPKWLFDAGCRSFEYVGGGDERLVDDVVENILWNIPIRRERPQILFEQAFILDVRDRFVVPFEVVVNPLEDRRAGIGRVAVRAQRAVRHVVLEGVFPAVHAVDLSQPLGDATIARHREPEVVIAVHEQEQPGGDQRPTVVNSQPNVL